MSSGKNPGPGRHHPVMRCLLKAALVQAFRKYYSFEVVAAAAICLCPGSAGISYAVDISGASRGMSRNNLLIFPTTICKNPLSQGP